MQSVSRRRNAMECVRQMLTPPPAWKAPLLALLVELEGPGKRLLEGMRQSIAYPYRKTGVLL
jgi:hypothetical protein